MEAFMRNFSNSNGNFINAQKQFIEKFVKYAAATNASTGIEIYEDDSFESFNIIGENTVKGTFSDICQSYNSLLNLDQALSEGIVFSNSPITIEPGIEVILAPSEGSPFDSIDDFLDDDEKLTGIIDYIRSQTNISFGQQLANRLEFLVEIAKEEEPGETPNSRIVKVFHKSPSLSP